MVRLPVRLPFLIFCRRSCIGLWIRVSLLLTVLSLCFLLAVPLLMVDPAEEPGDALYSGDSSHGLSDMSYMAAVNQPKMNYEKVMARAKKLVGHTMPKVGPSGGHKPLTAVGLLCEAHSRKHPLPHTSGEERSQLFIRVHNHNLVYCPVPKVGSTNLKRIFCNLVPSCPEPPEPSLHPFVNARLSVPPNDFHKVHAPQSFSVLFVRNPWYRLVSAYIEKVGLPKVAYLPCARVSPPKKVTFTEFLQLCVIASSETSVYAMDRHLMPVYAMCDTCERTYSFTGRLETYSNDISSLSKFLNLRKTSSLFADRVASESSFRRHNENKNMTGLQYGALWASVPNTTVQRIQSIYFLDIAQFGYAMSP